MRGVRAATAMLLALAASSCGHEHTASTAPLPSPPPQVVETYPAPGSQHVPYDLSEVWVRFAEPLDSASVTASSVFLKLDTRRAPIRVRWESATQRVVLTVEQPLELAETYTVELRPVLRTASGTALPETYVWQFSVSGLRRFQHPDPADEATHLSPYAPLGWDGTGASAGTVRYDLYRGADSAAVATRAVTPVSLSVAEYIPYDGPWPSGARVFWAVTARNLTLGEVENGPVWSFDTVAPGAPVDSLVIPAAFSGWYEPSTSRSFCGQSRLMIGGGVQPGVIWNLESLRPERAIAGAKIAMQLVVGSLPPPSNAVALHRPIDTERCALQSGTTPGDEVLAFSVNSGGPGMYYIGDALTAHLTAMHHGLASASGITMQSSRVGSYGTPPILILYFYR